MYFSMKEQQAMTVASQVQQPNVVAIQMDAEERTYLINLLKEELGDTRVEARRTDTPRYQEGLHRQEEIILRLLTKVQSRGG